MSRLLDIADETKHDEDSILGDEEQGQIRLTLSTIGGPITSHDFRAPMGTDAAQSAEPLSRPLSSRLVFSTNPHYPCAHSVEWPIFSSHDFQVGSDAASLPNAEYALMAHRFNLYDLVNCVLIAYSATTSLFEDSKGRERRELVGAVASVFCDNINLSIMQVFPSLRRWYGGKIIWSVDDGLIREPSVDEAIMILSNFSRELDNPYCLALYHRQHRVVTLNDIRENLTQPCRDALWAWVMKELEDIEGPHPAQSHTSHKDSEPN